MADYQLSKEDLYRWKIDPVGQEVIRAIREVRQTQVDMLTSGYTLNRPDGETARVVGIIQGLDCFLNFEVSD